MSFAAPAFLFGLFALAIPVLLHLSRRRTRQAVEFPSLMFLSQMHYRTVRRRRLREPLLLLLRCAALSLLVMGFARPLLRAAPQAATEEVRTVVVLLDVSYSMGYGDRFERAKQAVSDTMASLGPQDRLGLVTFAQSARLELPLGSDKGVTAAALERVELRPEATRYDSAVKLARSLLLDAPQSGRELVLISDLQRGDFGPGSELQLPEGTQVELVDVAADESGPVSNLTVSGVAVERSPISASDSRERVVVTARVVRRGEVAKGQLGLEATLSFDGRVDQQKQLELGSDAVANLSFDPFVAAADQSLRGEIQLSGDTLDADNAYRFVVSASDAITVLVVERSARDRSPYVEQALRTGREPHYEIVRRSAAGLRPDEIALARVVVVEAGLDRLDPSAREALARFVDSGGGLLVALGEDVSGSFPEIGLGPIPEVEQTFDGRSLAFLDYDHPIFQPFAASLSGDFSGIRLYRYRPVPEAPQEPSAPGAATDASNDSAVLARFDDGSPALVARSIGRGRTLVWGSSLDGEWSDFVVAPVFVPWIDRAVRYLAGFAPQPPAYSVGDVARIDLEGPVGRGEDTPREWALLAPDGSSRRLSGDQELLLTLEQTGFYELRPVEGADADGQVIAVNPQGAESDLTRADPEELRVAMAPVQGIAESAVAGEDEDTGSEQNQRNWWFVLIVALALMTVETLYANRRARARAAARTDATPAQAAGPA